MHKFRKKKSFGFIKIQLHSFECKQMLVSRNFFFLIWSTQSQRCEIVFHWNFDDDFERNLKEIWIIGVSWSDQNHPQSDQNHPRRKRKLEQFPSQLRTTFTPKSRRPQLRQVSKVDKFVTATQLGRKEFFENSLSFFMWDQIASSYNKISTFFKCSIPLIWILIVCSSSSYFFLSLHID